MIPKKKIQTAIEIARQDGFGKLGRSIASYYVPDKNPEIEPHLQMLQQREELVVAEIGVWKGDNAQKLCENLDMKKLYLIDPYNKYEDWDFPHSDAEELSNAELEAHDKLDDYPFVTWIKEHSDNAVEKIEDGLDYVYIDGNHSYDFVKSDIENYYKLVRDNGIVAGDDIHFSGVAQSVSEFAIEHNLQPHFESDFPDWYFVKGRKMNPSVDYRHTPENVYKPLTQDD